MNRNVILNKGKVKKKTLKFLSGGEASIALACGVISYIITQFITPIPLYPIIVAVGVAISVAMGFIELPNNMNLYKLLGLAFQYYVKEVREYYYYKEYKKVKEEKSSEMVANKEKRYKPTEPRKK